MYFKRGKRKILADYKMDDVYKFYKNKLGTRALDKKTAHSIWDRFIDVRLQMVIFENVEFTMPHRLGTIAIRLGTYANKIDKSGEFRYTVDWGATRKKWEILYKDKTLEEIEQIENKPLVPVSNENTDGRKVFWKWEKLGINYKNNKVYRIKMIRKWTKMLSHYVKQLDKIEYYEGIKF